MLKRLIGLVAAAAAIGLTLPASSFAHEIKGRVTNFSGDSVTVSGKEVVTVGLNHRTAFTKIIRFRPWQEGTHLTLDALRVGDYVVAHVPEGANTATWMQIDKDRPAGN